MASFTGNRYIRDQEFVQRVRRHKPSSLLPLIAATSARWNGNNWLRSHPLFPAHVPYRPWALAEAARTSLTKGDEHRLDATPDDLDTILNMHNALSDLYTGPGTRQDPDALWSFLLRITDEQRPFREHLPDSLSRTAAILTLTTPTKPPLRLVAGWDQDLLGCPLTDYVGIARLLEASAKYDSGRFRPDRIDTPGNREITDIIPAATITAVAEQHFVTDIHRFRQANAQTRVTTNPDLRRFEYNPLKGTPLISGFGDNWLAPCSHLIAPKASPAGLYYTGVAHYGDAFAQDLGDLFEQYIGRQLRLLPNATVHAEVTYGPKGQRKKSIDWFVVFDDLVLLVEVKSTRPTQQLRLNSDRRIQLLRKMLGKAYEQIDITADLIRRRSPGFQHIPADRPLHGLVLTMEIFDVPNAPFQRQYLPTTHTFVSVASASELERLVTLTDTTADHLLLNRAADPEQRTYSLRYSLDRYTSTPNPLLTEAWKTYPWSTPPDTADSQNNGTQPSTML